MLLRVLRSQHSAEGKALTAMGIVGDRDQISLRVIADGVDARHLTTTDMIDAQELLVRRILLPRLLTVDILHDFIGQRDGRATGMVEFVHMVRLLHLHIVLRELIHDLRQITVHGREDGHADAEVRGPEERLTLAAGLAHLVAVLLHPTRRTTHHLHALRPGFQVVAIGRLRSRELDGHIGRSKGLRIEVLLVVDVNDTHYLMATVQRDLFDHLAHLAVADQSYFHTQLLI